MENLNIESQLLIDLQLNFQNSKAILSPEDVERLFRKKKFLVKPSYWNRFYNNLDVNVDISFGTISGFLFGTIIDNYGSKKKVLAFYNPNPVLPVYLIKFEEIGSILSLSIGGEFLKLKTIDQRYHLYQTNEKATIHYKTTDELKIPLKHPDEVDLFKIFISKIN